MASLDVKLKKASKVYKEGDVVKETVVVNSKGELNHNGVTLTMEGMVTLQLSAKSVGVFEAFYNFLKPIQLVNYSIDIAKPGKFPNGTTEIPFAITSESQIRQETLRDVPWSVCEYYVHPSS